MGKYLGPIFYPIVVSLLGYLFSLHVDFISLKGQVSDHEKNFTQIINKIDKVDSKIDYILENFKH